MRCTDLDGRTIKQLPIERTAEGRYAVRLAMPRFETGDRFWDHYDLTTFEHADYYADGRDLGENYALGSWLLSPCVTKGTLNCTHCHTSSGRYRFTGVKANHACMPCHAQRVQDPADHIHHPSVTQCVSCPMPMNPFGGMNQSEHSMRPPMPHLSMATGSRNACIQCHEDQKHEWALEHGRGVGFGGLDDTVAGANG